MYSGEKAMKDKWATRMVGLLSILLASLLLGLYLTLSSAGSLAQEPVGAMPGNVLALLEMLASLPVQEYSLKSQDPSIRHIGLVAQDSAAFGYGESDLAINMQDADGVALAAIQGLYARGKCWKRRSTSWRRGWRR
jgi:hypothetical protein